MARYAKHHLPNYGVFDEFRYFVPGDRFPVLRCTASTSALTICEDLWQDGGPIAVAAGRVGLVLCINGSPYERQKSYTRDELAARRAREAGAALAYVNMVGGQDELVFDGDSLIVDAAGELVARAPQFAETLLVSDLDLPFGRQRHSAARSTPATAPGWTWSAHSSPSEPLAHYAPRRPTDHRAGSTPTPSSTPRLVLGTRDYVMKNGFRSRRAGPVRRHRLGAGRDDRRRRPRRRRRAHRRDAIGLLLGALGE